MSQLEKRRRKFMIEIKRKANEEYFRARREILLREDEPEPQCEYLYQLVKRSLARNGLSAEIGNIVEELKQVLARGETREKYEYMLAICSNLLIDDLKLEEKEAITSLMYEIYQFLSLNMSNQVIQRISYSLLTFTNAIPCLHQEFADDCQHLLYKMIQEMICIIIRWQSSQDATQIAESIMQALTNTISFQPQYKSQLEVLFSHNFTFFDQLLKYHRYLLGDKNKMHHRVLREGILNVFEHLSNEIVLNQHPIIFQSEHFIDFVISEILEAGTSQWQKMALNILTNLLIDYEETEFFSLLEGLDRAGDNCVQMILKNLLMMDCNTFHRLKLLKTIISIKQVYDHLKPFFQEYWREVVDFCVQMLKSDRVDIIRLSALILLILGDISSNRDGHLQYMRNLGCQSLFQDLLLMIQEARSAQLQDEVEEVNSALSHMLFSLQQDWLA